MTQDNAPKEFHRGPQITVQMQLTPEQSAVMKEWAESIPTFHFLDICAVNATKLPASALQNDARKASYFAYLQSLDRSQHCFSYLCALIEKVSDTRGIASDAELEEQILQDMAALRAFFKNARVYESDDFVIRYLRDLRRAPHELARHNYLNFLEAINSQFSLKDPVSPALRLQKSAEILREADALSIARQHPIVLLTLACLYGNPAAKKLMKFKADSQKFNAENALADIMAISRFSSLKLEIEHIGRQSGGYMRSEFLTDDNGLAGVFRCFEAKAVRHEQKGDSYEIRIEVGVKLEELLTDLAVKHQITPNDTKEAAEQRSDEYEQIFKLLLQEPEGASEPDDHS